MSDGITDAKRECKPIKYTSPRINPAPIRCKNCIFITRNPHDNQWECTNPLQHGKCDEPNNCAFHITLDELAIYTRERLKSKLIGESKVICKFYVESESYGTCKNMNWHHNGSYRCNCEGDTSKCKFWKDKSIGESNMLDKTPRCKHILDNGKCSELHTKYDFQCPFVVIWDIAKTMCKGYDANVRYEVHVLGKSTSIIGVFKSHEQAEQFIKDNIKIVEMTS
jgi:hypothetical protein